jgi:hypothetical protein
VDSPLAGTTLPMAGRGKNLQNPVMNQRVLKQFLLTWNTEKVQMPEDHGNRPLKTAGTSDYVCARRAAPADIPSRQA